MLCMQLPILSMFFSLQWVTEQTVMYYHLPIKLYYKYALRRREACFRAGWSPWTSYGVSPCWKDQYFSVWAFWAGECVLLVDRSSGKRLSPERFIVGGGGHCLTGRDSHAPTSTCGSTDSQNKEQRSLDQNTHTRSVTLFFALDSVDPEYLQL